MIWESWTSYRILLQVDAVVVQKNWPWGGGGEGSRWLIKIMINNSPLMTYVTLKMHCVLAGYVWLGCLLKTCHGLDSSYNYIHEIWKQNIKSLVSSTAYSTTISMSIVLAKYKFKWMSMIWLHLEYMPTLMCVRAPHTAKDIHEVQLEGSQNLYEEWPHTTGTQVTVHEWP